MADSETTTPSNEWHPKGLEMYSAEKVWFATEQPARRRWDAPGTSVDEPATLPSVHVVCCCSVAIPNATVLAVVTSDHRVVLACALTKDGGERQELLVETIDWRPHPITGPFPSACTLSDDAHWLVLLLGDGSLEVVPTSLVLGGSDILGDGDVSRTGVDTSPALFSPDEFTRIPIRTRNDCLAVPTYAVWYQAKSTGRPLLIYSNKGGDICFIDLLLRKLSASLGAPQSIHRLDVMTNSLSGDTYLLVTGFAGTQWVVPVETEGQSVRQTLGHIIPSELKQLGPVDGNRVSPVFSQNTACLGIFNAIGQSFDIYNTMDFNVPTVSIKLPENTWTVEYANSIIFGANDEVEIFAKFNFFRTVEEVSSVGVLPKFTQKIFRLDDDEELKELFLVRHAAMSEMPLANCFVVTDKAIYFVKAIMTVEQLLSCCVEGGGGLQLAPSLCSAVGVDFGRTVLSSLPTLFDRCHSGVVSPDAVLQLCEKAELPLTQIASLFHEHGFAAFILGHINRWLLQRRARQLPSAPPAPDRKRIPSLIFSPLANAATEPTSPGVRRRQTPLTDFELERLSHLAAQLHMEGISQATDYRRNVARHNFRDFLLHNQWYDSEWCLKESLRLRLWDCAAVLLQLHDLSAAFVTRMIAMDKWADPADDFVDLLTFTNFAHLLNTKPALAVEYLHRLRDYNAGDGSKSKRLVLSLLNLTSPNRPEIAAMRCNRHRLDLASCEKVLFECASTFLSTLIRHLYSAENEDDLSLSAADGVRPQSRSSRSSTGGGRASSMASTNDELGAIERCTFCPMACGPFHGVLAASDGLYCWGRRKEGLLGCASPTDSEPSIAFSSNISSRTGSTSTSNKQCTSQQPVRIHFPYATRCIKQVACGAEHSIVLTDDGRLFSWGLNRFGQLGNGSRVGCAEPQMIESLWKKGQSVRSIKTGHYHCTAITTENHLFTWGWGIHGQLGLSKHCVDDSCEPELVTWFTLHDLEVHQVVCGYAHTLTVCHDGVVYAFGNGTYGQTGLGSTTKATLPTRVTLADHDRSAVVVVASSAFHNVAITRANKMHTWGAAPQTLKFKALLQKRKRIANAASTVDVGDPQKKATMATLNSEGLTTVDDVSHLKPQLCDPGSIFTGKSVESSLSRIYQLECGAYHTTLLTTSGQLYTWGKSLEFQLGHGDKKERSAPTLLTSVGDGKQWRFVSCGAEHTMAIDRNGRPWGWGRNDFAQLGFESVTSAQVNRLAQKILTIQRPNKTDRTITLPPDSRVFVQKPTKLVGLTVVTTPYNFVADPLTSVAYDETALFEALKLYNGYYDTETLAQLCRNYNATSISAFIWLMSDLLTAALRSHAEALKAKLLLTDGRTTLESGLTKPILHFYHPFFMRIRSLIELKAAIAVLVNEMPFEAVDLEQFFDDQPSFWVPTLAQVMKCDPKLLAKLSAPFKFRLLKTAARLTRDQSERRLRGGGDKEVERQRSVQVLNQSVVDDGDTLPTVTIGQPRYCYVFNGCRHSLGEHTVEAQLGQLQTLHTVNTVLPRTAATVLNMFTDDLHCRSSDPLTGGWHELSASLCPACLGEKLVEIAQAVKI